MRPETEPNRKDVSRGEIISRLRKDLRFLVFYVSPLLEDFQNDLPWLASKYNMPRAQAEEFRAELLRTGLWRPNADGRIQTDRAVLGLDGEEGQELTTSQFVALISQILFRISDDGPCWYGTKTVATSQALKNEFLSKMSGTMNSFVEQSKAAKGETIVSWTFISLDPLKALQQEESP